MGKNPRKTAPRKPKHTPLPRTSFQLRSLATYRLNINKKTQRPTLAKQHQNQSNLLSLLNQERLTCSVCLQLLLHPVLAQCGHTFCLACAQELALHGFACSMCHSHQPHYDQPSSPAIQEMVDHYLSQAPQAEGDDYAGRLREWQIKESMRRVQGPEQGQPVDYWCDQSLEWKNGTISQVLKNGLLTIVARKSEKEAVQIDSNSRRLAPYRMFSKEKVPEMRIRPMLFRRDMDGVHMGMGERQNRMFGMPYFVGYYWPNNNNPPGFNDDLNGRGPNLDGFNPFTF